MQSSRDSPQRGPGPGPQARERATECPPRSAPGRCPCRCIHGRPRWRRAASPAPPGGGRSGPGEGRDERVLALVEPVRLHRGNAEVLRHLSTCIDDLELHGTGLERARPARSADGPRRRRPGRRPPAPRSPPASISSVSHRTATEVSRPPLYARTTRLLILFDPFPSPYRAHASEPPHGSTRREPYASTPPPRTPSPELVVDIPARAERRSARSPPPGPSEATTRMVSSPATVPRTPGNALRSIAEATT